MSRDSREKREALAQAITATGPLFRLFLSIARKASLLNAATGDDREPLISQLGGELRQAARHFDQLDHSLRSAWRLFEGLLEDVAKAGAGRLSLVPSRPPVVRSHQDLMRLGLIAEDEEPSDLVPDALELWRAGFSVGTANRLARLGFRTAVEVAIFHESLPGLPGMEPEIVREICGVVADLEEIARAASAAPQIKLRRRRPREKKNGATIDWAAVGRKIQERLEKMGGSGTLTDLLGHTPGLPASRIKRGILMLEKAGVVTRSGVKRSTRYHLALAKPAPPA